MSKFDKIKTDLVNHFIEINKDTKEDADKQAELLLPLFEKWIDPFANGRERQIMAVENLVKKSKDPYSIALYNHLSVLKRTFNQINIEFRKFFDEAEVQINIIHVLLYAAVLAIEKKEPEDTRSIHDMET